MEKVQQAEELIISLSRRVYQQMLIGCHGRWNQENRIDFRDNLNAIKSFYQNVNRFINKYRDWFPDMEEAVLRQAGDNLLGRVCQALEVSERDMKLAIGETIYVSQEQVKGRDNRAILGELRDGVSADTLLELYETRYSKFAERSKTELAMKRSNIPENNGYMVYMIARHQPQYFQHIPDNEFPESLRQIQDKEARLNTYKEYLDKYQNSQLHLLPADFVATYQDTIPAPIKLSSETLQAVRDANSFTANVLTPKSIEQWMKIVLNLDMSTDEKMTSLQKLTEAYAIAKQDKYYIPESSHGDKTRELAEYRIKGDEHGLVGYSSGNFPSPISLVNEMMDLMHSHILVSNQKKALLDLTQGKEYKAIERAGRKRKSKEAELVA